MGSPNTEFMQTTAAIYGEGYKEGLELIDEEGVVQVPYNSGVASANALECILEVVLHYGVSVSQPKKTRR